VAVRGQAYRDIGRVPSIPASIIPTLARVMPQNLAVSLRSNQQSRVSCFARSADFKLGQQVAAESPAIACSSHQISMVAAAITTPVTNAAKHENSRRSFSTPVMAASPMRASHVG
jgi:hypothetical protein